MLGRALRWDSSIADRSRADSGDGKRADAAVRRGVSAGPERYLMSSTHKFDVGHHVHFNAGAVGPDRPPVKYEIIRQLPLQGIEFEYQVRQAGASADRVVRESRLSLSPAALRRVPSVSPLAVTIKA